MGKITKKPIRYICFCVVLFLLLLVTLFPILWMLLASFKKIVELLNPNHMFVFTPTVKNYVDVFIKYDFFKPIFNSFFIGTISTILACLFGLPTAFSIARYKQSFLGSLILVIRIIPAISFLVPWYIIFSGLKLNGTFAAMIIAHMLISLPFIIWIMVPYFESIPKELEQSARIDGSSLAGTFLRISLPLSRPGILTATILSFIFSWNNFMFALVLSSAKTRTLPMAIFNFVSYTDVNWGGLMAAAMVIMTPIIVISIILQKYVVSGLTAGAVKG